MTNGVKGLLIGCVVLIFVGLVSVGVGGYFLKNWVQKKSAEVGNALGTKDSEYGKKTEELKKKYPFTAPADKVITEDELVRFLAVRKSLYSVWMQHEAEFKEMTQKKEAVSSAFKGLEVMQEVRKVQVTALDSQHMGPDEYTFLDSSVYGVRIKAMMDGLRDGVLQTQIDTLDKQLKEPNLSEDARKQLTEMRDNLQKSLVESKQSTQSTIAQETAAIPPQNMELFKRHQQEIDQYWMDGLQNLGM